MKKLALMLALVAGMTFSASSAHAIILDPSFLGGGLGETSVFNQLSVYAETESTLTSPTTFIDKGSLVVNGLIASGPVDDQDLNSVGGWLLTAVWSDLSGSTTTIDSGTNLQVQNTYLAGHMDMYATLQSAPGTYDFGALGFSDDTGFTTGTKVASLSLKSGFGSLFPNKTPITGSTDLFWDFTYMKAGFWKDNFGNDLKDEPLIVAFADSKVGDVSFPNPSVTLATHNGSVDVTIPEPATMILFGSGLMGFIARRKKKVIA